MCKPLGCNAQILSVMIFATSLFLHITFGAYEGTPTSLAASAIVALTGLVAGALALRRIWKRRKVIAAFPFLCVLSLFLAWSFAPTAEISSAVRFKLELPEYRTAIEKVSHGDIHGCSPEACLIDRGLPTYLVFPWRGLLSGWIGVVYDPTDNMHGFLSHKPTFTAEIIGCRKLGKNFFLCDFG